ncbi:Cytochrome b5-like heme/steroid binding protein [Glarea lozoyensis ATCC 20868]|uniref:Cytochrome b5-like heme/steroid binding protein n=1 Tax=Glarea lozoyensis (strain ATCC 20868 / MF5171) TaxID=1116229 RepID=S3D681_GLAL2|nr:Cytochrome b5-like heme/steroid binding protein [Glarea lozoyensis ATCC 20868]EPE27571.1 Cytochrome b5-like heme/steroid binding protein [Glarea lozoyensis ATCC 20868]
MAGKFEPKTPVDLAPPKDDPISTEFLSKCNGKPPLVPRDENSGGLCYVAIKGRVFDVSRNKMYAPGGSYHVFAGHDASRALGMTSTKAEDVVPDWSPLTDKEKSVLEDWFMFFSKRYNIVGMVEGATNQ